MAITLTADDARQSLNAHVAAKGAELREKYPHMGWQELLRVLEDRACVRYPCDIVFEAAPLQPGEFAHPVGRGERPEDGFTIYIHPFFLTRLAEVPCLVLYQLVLVNYGPFASASDAEAFGAAALGLSVDEYYECLCGLADKIGGCESV
ncbi:MAG TPA: hypothetical protein VFD66_01350 [Verrucomicrobiae bacterium]|nr:hypothetical protein [Verrucomicrobiae bacterium]